MSKKILRDSWIICIHELKQSLRSWKILVVLILYFAILFGGLNIADDIQVSMDDILAQTEVEGLNIYELIGERFGNLNVVVPFMIAMLVLPFIMLFMSFDVVSDDRLANRFRYLFSRTRLESILLGKFFANILLLSVSTILFFMISNLYLQFRLGEAAGFFSFAYPWLLLTFYIASLSAFFILTSSFFKKPFASLAAGIIGLILLAVISSYDYLRYIGIFEYLRHAIDATTNQIIISIVMFTVLSVLYLSLSWARLWRVDA